MGKKMKRLLGSHIQIFDDVNKKREHGREEIIK